MQIWGAGLSGLLAACAFPHADIFEAQSSDHYVGHKALLRFRSTVVSDLTGIPFRKVRVHKGLFLDRSFVPPSIALANWYSMKVTGRLADRSVWNLDPVDRYVAPEDFLDQLLARHAPRIHWSCDALAAHDPLRPTVSTLPLHVMLRWVADKSGGRTAEEYWPSFPQMQRSSIVVRRWRIPNADVFQTVYFPDPARKLYRASITGSMLIEEFVGEVGGNGPQQDTRAAFGLGNGSYDSLGEVAQSHGKIVPIEDGFRKSLILDLSMNHNVFSLGRFATWRNILADDVVHDIAVIRRLIHASQYELSMAAHGRTQ